MIKIIMTLKRSKLEMSRPKSFGSFFGMMTANVMKIVQRRFKKEKKEEENKKDEARSRLKTA